jgi:hypothetical protein
MKEKEKKDMHTPRDSERERTDLERSEQHHYFAILCGSI